MIQPPIRHRDPPHLYFLATFFLPTTLCLTLELALEATAFFLGVAAAGAFLPAMTFFGAAAGAGAGAVSTGGSGISTAAALVLVAGDFALGAAVFFGVDFDGVSLTDAAGAGAAAFCFLALGSSLCITLSSLSSSSTKPRLIAFSALLMTFSSASLCSELISEVQIGSMTLAEVLIPIDLTLSHCPEMRDTTAGMAAVRFSSTWSALWASSGSSRDAVAIRTELEGRVSSCWRWSRSANVRACTQAFVEKGRRDGSTEFSLQVLPSEGNRNRLLLGIEKDFAEQFGHGRHDPCVTEKDVVCLHQRTPRLERLVLSPELLEADDPIDKLDVVRCEEILVFSLRVLDEETDG